MAGSFRVVCAWCTSELQAGSEPASHTICDPCYETFVRRIPEPAPFDGRPRQRGRVR